MELRAFPVLYAKDVDALAGFYARLGFVETFRLADEQGDAGFMALQRGRAELGITTENSPRRLIGVEPGPGPRHELFVYVEDVDRMIASLRESGAEILKEPADMPWGERTSFVADPEGNLISLATSL